MNRAGHITVSSVVLACMLLGGAATGAGAATIHPGKTSIGISVPRVSDFTLVEMPFDLRNGPMRSGSPQLRVANRSRFKKSPVVVFGGVRKVGKQWVAGALIIRLQSAKASRSASTTVDLQIVGRSATIDSGDVVAHPNVLSEPRAITNLTAACSESFEPRARKLVGASGVTAVRKFLRAYKPASAIAAACSEDAGSQNNALRKAIAFNASAPGAIDCRGSHQAATGSETDRIATFSCAGQGINRFLLRGPAESPITGVTAPAEPAGTTCQLIQDGSTPIADCLTSSLVTAGTEVSGTRLAFAAAPRANAELQVEVYAGGSALLDFLIAPR